MKTTFSESLRGVCLIEPRVHSDARGFFLESYQRNRYRDEAGLDLEFVQDNHSQSFQGVLRGLHFQKSRPQGKLVRCVRGEIFDVVVDICPGSDTFGVWEGFVLTEENKHQVWVPPGYAHGFQVLSEVAEMEYKCTDYYVPEDEGCLAWDDPDVGIDWPIDEPVLSGKDRLGISLASFRE